MATRIQAKNAIDAVVVLVKADIDLIPSTANIVWGTIRFSPNSWVIYLQVANLQDGITLKDALVAALVGAGRTATTTFTVQQPIRETSVWPPDSAIVRTITVSSGNSKFTITIP